MRRFIALSLLMKFKRPGKSTTMRVADPAARSLRACSARRHHVKRLPAPWRPFGALATAARWPVPNGVQQISLWSHPCGSNFFRRAIRIFSRVICHHRTRAPVSRQRGAHHAGSAIAALLAAKFAAREFALHKRKNPRSGEPDGRFRLVTSSQRPKTAL
jgi:hypothetical protein